VPELMKTVKAGDAVLTLGAGSIGSIPKRLIDALKKREAGA
jgi:UDP-N-acetylmuramate-alanine ligase